ncbi:hypothetical protein PR048_021740 [Dryococelus australis]|uniref:Transposase n=1 Tax=Dryococelus australis TaxID=614101 RepID=A0ABQ9GZ46_9NEOP|nr:hypothetical protein PR048_021740 [Dryococelus australis]
MWVWRRRGTQARRSTVQKVHAYRGGGILIWGGIMLGHRTPLVRTEGTLTARRYVTDVLQTSVHPYRQAFGETFLLEDDNSRTHRAGLVDQYCQQAGI